MNRSKELCELLGVFKTCTERRCMVQGCDANNDNFCFHGDNFIKKNKKILHYPDFEKPDNFVKLLECYLFSYHSILITSFYKNDDECKPIELFLNNVLEELKDDNDKFIEDFKQQAQQTDWSY
jgi:hypothetical protein